MRLCSILIGLLIKFLAIFAAVWPSITSPFLFTLLATQASKATGNQGNITTYNKAASPSDIFQRNPSNQTDVRTSTDLVSALSQFQQGGKKEEIQSNKDPLTAHNLDQLI